ncbi:hypothetical protein CLV34_2984 [Luteimicrobium subarcticum]|uniref:Uncharacterized protein n=1 Tax=Luteimicrobium subarcticum TaxID=620910 RepID=A0A2M8W3G6_9MICO|nr:hypothetical protein CLV34_2984 [Luteimicrobium subarcticum]
MWRLRTGAPPVRWRHGRVLVAAAVVVVLTFWVVRNLPGVTPWLGH